MPFIFPEECIGESSFSLDEFSAVLEENDMLHLYYDGEEGFYDLNKAIQFKNLSKSESFEIKNILEENEHVMVFKHGDDNRYYFYFCGGSDSGSEVYNNGIGCVFFHNGNDWEVSKINLMVNPEEFSFKTDIEIIYSGELPDRLNDEDDLVEHFLEESLNKQKKLLDSINEYIV